MHALVCVGPDLNALGHAIILGDYRAAAEADEIIREVGSDVVVHTTGTGMDPSMPAAKMRWLWRHQPELWEKTEHILGCKDFVRLRLTGEVATEPVDACATGLYDIRGRCWSEELLTAAKAGRRTLPGVIAPEAIAGPLLAEAADALGLRVGTPVIVGAGDDVEVLGNGLLQPGAALEHLGTTGSVLAVIAGPAENLDDTLELYPHTIEGLWLVGASMTTAGAALDWARRALGYESLEEASRCLASWPLSPNAPVFLPHLAGSRSPTLEPFARGAWIGLGPETNREELMLAAFEGVALGIRAILARTELFVDTRRPITVSAGKSAEPLWLQLRADLYQRPLSVLQTSEPTALGVLTLATAALGIDPNVAAAVQRLVRYGEVIQPALSADHVAARIMAYDLISSSLRSAWAALPREGSA
jgi:xylulokinase